ncbi:acetamidase/formamidase family protein [Amycolatopsis endophytica]|uniref:Acetamidase/formamidase n=1 Tax=Amycolatopsis endophytica TaxID=860233 RepID=A0A853AX34_9PSEU|nr:acetamidase/formamidase family protein [Amycolatopsis endophytica]NYI87199.1 acetamidase/formamidase [Amycolatopsis endophytica]
MDLEPSPDTTTDVLSRDTPPVLTVDPGETVRVRSLDAHGNLEPQRTPGERCPRMFPESRGHCLTGPIAVRGARPGDVLAVRLRSLRPDGWGFTVAAAKENWLTRRLGVAGGDPAWLLWELRDGTGTNQFGQRVRLAPFLGVIGLPPDEPGEHSTIPPRPEGGGNIDCRELVAGSTLYLPVTVPEALLHLGDGHAAQGDGEVAGTAIECGMTTEVTLDLLTEAAVPGIHAETPAGRVTFGFHTDLNEASATALDAMLTWLEALHGVDRTTALALAGPTVDLRVTQIANGTWGVHALLPWDAIG